MVQAWLLLALSTLAGLSFVRAAECEDINTYLSIPDPMTGDMEIILDDVSTIACPEFDEGGDFESVVIRGGTLTIKSSENVRFVNFGFTVKSGASLVFDMPKTKFGPNAVGFHREAYYGSTVEIEAGASAVFLGKLVVKEVQNVFSVFRNSGYLEVKKAASFADGSNVFRINTGIVKFRGNASFVNHRYLALNNEESGYVRFSKDAEFVNNAYNFDGASGCSIANSDPEGTIIFRGDVVVRDNFCSEGTAVSNAGYMKFVGKAYFNDNQGDSNAGAVTNSGSMRFKSAVQFNGNIADDEGTGGGIATGGNVTFSKGVTFDGNSADTGAAFAVFSEGLLEFEKPNVVRNRNGVVTGGEDSDKCLFGYVQEGGTVIGFSEDEICDPA